MQKLCNFQKLNPELLDKLSQLNKRIAVKKRFKHILVLEERKFKFEDYEFVPFKFPPKLFKNNDFDVLYTLNNDFNFEQPGNNSINIKMGTFSIISAITAAIISSLYIWARTKKSGRVFGENGEFQFKDEKDKMKRYMPDASFISFDKASEEEQKSWKKRAKVAPTLAIEILSSKKPIELERNLNKMQNVWIKNGTDIGIVIDSFRKKYYVFEQGKPGFVEEDIHKPFTHPLLPGYVGEYGVDSELL